MTGCHHYNYLRSVLLLSLFIGPIFHISTLAQTDCVFKDPVVKIDFGTGFKGPDVNLFRLSKYERVDDNCPNDGNYAYATQTSDCFAGDWFTLNEDHTEGDVDGRMMLVNASETGGVFLTMPIGGFKPNTQYELSQWMMNVCRIGGGCAPLPPKIIITIKTPGGKKIAEFYTGILLQTTSPRWRNYNGFFTTPGEVESLILTMEDITIGGCGNDFALDDIVIRECSKIEPVKADTKTFTTPAPSVSSPAKPTPKKETPKPTQAYDLKPVAEEIKNTKPIAEIPGSDLQKPQSPYNQPGKNVDLKPLPTRVLERESPLIKTVESEAGEMVIELYDNGEIDGDTVSVFHNNEPVVSGARLTASAVTFKIKIDSTLPRHELLMVAENLGTIPPNTSLMILTINGKSHKVFISASEQKNAKIVIKLKE